MLRSLNKTAAAAFLLISPSLFCEDISNLIPAGSTPEKAVETLLSEQDLTEEEYRGRLIAAAEIKQVTGELTEAADLFKKASLAVKGSKDFNSLYRAALIRVETADYRAAEAEIRAINTFSENIALRLKANVLLSRIRMLQGRSSEALDVMAEILMNNVELSAEAYSWAKELKGSGFEGSSYENFKKVFDENKIAEKTGYLIKKIPTPASIFGLTGKDREQIVISVPETQSVEPAAAVTEKATAAEPAGNDETMIQIGSFTRAENAVDLRKTVAEFGFTAEIKKKTVNGTEYNVVVIPVNTEDIQSVIIKLKEKGFEGYPLY